MKRVRNKFRNINFRIRKPNLSKIKNINLKKATYTFAILGVITGLGVGGFWYFTEYNKSERLYERQFWSAIDTALSTPSVVKTTTSGGSGQQDINRQRIFTSNERLIQTAFETNVNNPAQSFTLAINTEAQQYFDGINYIRYTKYQSSEGTDLEEFIGQWAVQDTPEEQINDFQAQFVSGLVSIVMFADFNPTMRNEVVEQLRDSGAYQINAQDALVGEIDGDKVVQIPVSISLRGYITALNNAFKKSGYAASGLNPDEVREGASLNGTISIRKRDSVVVQVAYGTVQETYSNYGVNTRPERPTDTVPYEDLQRDVQQKLSQGEN